MGKESRKHAHIHTVLFAITNSDVCERENTTKKKSVIDMQQKKIITSVLICVEVLLTANGSTLHLLLIHGDQTELYTTRGDYCIILYPNVQCTSVSVWYIS